MTSRKMSKSTADKGSEGNKKDIRNWKKKKSCYIAVESLAQLCPTVI